MKELNLAFVAMLSWCAATFFTDGVEQIVDNYFVQKYHSKAIIYIIFALIFVFINVYITSKH